MTTTTRRITYNPETIANLEAAITAKIMRGKDLSEQLFDIHRARLAGRPTNPPAWVIRAQIELLNDELALDFAELDRRRI